MTQSIDSRTVTQRGRRNNFAILLSHTQRDRKFLLSVSGGETYPFINYCEAEDIYISPSISPSPSLFPSLSLISYFPSHLFISCITLQVAALQRPNQWQQIPEVIDELYIALRKKDYNRLLQMLKVVEQGRARGSILPAFISSPLRVYISSMLLGSSPRFLSRG